ncbi:hypothetical protein [Cellulomonas sp. URHB0016]
MTSPAGTVRRTDVRVWPLVLLLMVVAPVSAEYLTAYDPEVTGRPWQLLGGLLVLAPLYGGPAVLIREVAARTRMHWTGILALAGAFGVLEAGVVDQSLFARYYMEYADWGDWIGPTLVAPIGVSGAFALNFLVGHVVWSIGAPIALVEAFDRRPGRQPWLRVPGIAVLTLLWVLASVAVWSDSRTSGSDPASAAQLAGAVTVAAVLVVVACTFGRRTLPAPAPTRVPSPARVGGLVLVPALGYGFIPFTWVGVAVGVLILAITGVVVTAWSRSAAWGPRHVAGVAGAAVVARAISGFATVASASPRPAGGFAQNTVLLVLSAALVLAALRAASHPGRAAADGLSEREAGG